MTHAPPMCGPAYCWQCTVLNPCTPHTDGDTDEQWARKHQELMDATKRQFPPTPGQTPPDCC